MAHRERYLIAYDISDHRRLSKVHKKVEAFAIGGQKSFYECWFTKGELALFKADMDRIIEITEDRVFIFQISPCAEPMLFGKARLQSTSPFLII
ncbi:TPA: CRISPR-associated endonuclease Cas2 [Pasteurella multocida]|uniref:CRISPR-associated endonuclease Cas2 n=1 Tax=Pasteurella multocida TaxID=747 RepID=UPI0007ED99AA|nr:CRISPR-associated endonuclease Cas2 [Pasteurella multocida]MCL7789002.1 CRISPR-associated endonuclease Cas2 [Pasteurella multocida]OBP31031.1 CRISPR-associated endonuclease Cas2 [Pasteurella multocida subsp. multocida]PNM07751.1 CRISPR-associated endonuclease Cas2 [Pasteurella multocida]HDR1287290.1 CRISPR-associated endonuclease Cas2 [Pasteurella multocida]HDR1436049.1 CRISPR-associated endonuclease Cas2 [Pasteurella multocida]